MSEYNPPVSQMLNLIYDVLQFKHDDLDRETSEAILLEASKLASDVLAPINKSADEEGATRDEQGNVKTAAGFKEAYQQYCEGGWNAVPFDPEFGGQGLPYLLAFPLQEMWQGANMSFGLCPLLNQGAVEAISHHGSAEQKAFYLPKLISGEWTGTMNLTEPQAGSDLGLVRTKASPDGKAYKISGQKIFITYGEHDMTDNIIHLVLARLDDAPDDVKGISLFIVPKFLEDGTRNNVKCIGLEHKLGIHASPTCTMEFDGATGYLIGQANEGLKYMFTMMNNARLSVGLQGVAIAERAYQHALAYAEERVQGKDYKTGERTVIANHTDIKRMLKSMKSQIAAGRALTYAAAQALDEGDDVRVDILTPLVKSWCTDMACEVTSLGVQVFGGMGFIEETGAAQFYRDARILPIYEGTNGIQALDLAFRKTLRDSGKSVKTFIGEMLWGDDKELEFYKSQLLQCIDELIVAGNSKDLDLVEAMASPYLKAFAIIVATSLLGKGARFSVDAQEQADFFRYNILPHAGAYIYAAIEGSKTLVKNEE